MLQDTYYNHAQIIDFTTALIKGFCESPRFCPFRLFVFYHCFPFFFSLLFYTDSMGNYAPIILEDTNHVDEIRVYEQSKLYKVTPVALGYVKIF